MTEEKIREIIREEIEIFAKNFSENLAKTEKIEEKEKLEKKTEIVTSSVIKTILHYIALVIIIFYGALFGWAILAQILAKIFNISWFPFGNFYFLKKFFVTLNRVKLRFLLNSSETKKKDPEINSEWQKFYF